MNSPLGKTVPQYPGRKLEILEKAAGFWGRVPSVVSGSLGISLAKSFVFRDRVKNDAFVRLDNSRYNE